MPASGVAEVRRRLARLGEMRVSSGMLSAPECAALAGVGFRQVSEVIGGVAISVQESGFFSAGLATPAKFPRGWQGGSDGAAPPIYTSSGRSSVPSRIRAMRSGIRTALARLVEEARAVGADGVIDIRMDQTRTASAGISIWSFLASGTAVRSIGETHAATPFTSALSATQTASALRGGWVPLSYLTCPVMAVRWVEPASRKQERLSSANGEIGAYSDTVNVCRRQAGTDFAAAARAMGADGAVMADLTLELGPARDMAEVSVFATGTALVRFSGRGGPETLTILPLAGVRGE
jgi:uncharacterized protein YbjQ (UPF0145 family)